MDVFATLDLSDSESEPDVESKARSGSNIEEGISTTTTIADRDGDRDRNETPREARVRRAIEAARKSYVPQEDRQGWFLLRQEQEQEQGQQSANGDDISKKASGSSDGVALMVENDTSLTTQVNTDVDTIKHALDADKRAALYLDYSLHHLYATRSYTSALQLSISLLAALDFAVPYPISRPAQSAQPAASTSSSTSPSAAQRSQPQPAPKAKSGSRARFRRKREIRNPSSVREALDVGLRVCLRLLPSSASSADARTRNESSVAPCNEDVPETMFSMRDLEGTGAGETCLVDVTMVARGLVQGSRDFWANTPGLAMSAGEVAIKLGRYRDAIEAFSYFVEARGTLLKVMHLFSIAANGYASELLAQQRRTEPVYPDGHYEEAPEAQRLDRNFSSVACLSLASIACALAVAPRSKRGTLSDEFERAWGLTGLTRHKMDRRVGALTTGQSTESRIRAEEVEHLAFESALVEPLAWDSKNGQEDTAEAEEEEEEDTVLPKHAADKLGRALRKRGGVYALMKKAEGYLNGEASYVPDEGEGDTAQDEAGEIHRSVRSL